MVDVNVAIGLRQSVSFFTGREISKLNVICSGLQPLVSIEIGLEDLAKYPFLRKAGEHVKELGLRIEDLGHSDYANVVKRARERIIQAAKQGQVSQEISEVESEILSFPLALMLVKATGIEYLESRISYAEAIRAERLLEVEKKPIVTHIFRWVLGIDLIDMGSNTRGQEFDFKIPIIEYLRRSHQFHKPEWKLVNRVVTEGWVCMKTHDLIRLIREEIRRIIYTRLKAINVPRLPPSLQEVVEDVSRVSPTPVESKDIAEAAPRQYPPCVLHALDLLKKGQNMPHYARFLMTTYLLAVGKIVDDIVNLFPKMPDFNEHLTRYQVEHIAGLRGGRVKYKVPTCRTLRTHSFCFRIKECGIIKSPIQFGRGITKKKSRKSR